MAVYVVTDSPDVDWDEDHKYKYRHESTDGSLLAQDEMDRRRAAGQPAYLWRWENNQPTLIERFDAEPGAAADGGA